MNNWLNWKFGEKKAFHLCALLIQLHIDVIEYAAGHLHHISEVHARKARRSFYFLF